MKGFNGFNGRRGAGQNPNTDDFQSIFEDLFGGGFGGSGKKGRSRNNSSTD
jgi:DnaJ-class molecular chaperone